MPVRVSLIVSLALAALMLGGCDSLYRALGSEKVIPDEFDVVSRAPLAIPPDYSLRPPRFGEQRPQEETTQEQARQTVFRVGDDQASKLPAPADQRSPGETELLKEAGAADAPKDIRQLVDTDASQQMSDSFVDKLAFWRKDDKPAPNNAVINPVAEEDRLKGGGGNAPTPDLAGKPRIERTQDNSSSWFGWLF